MKLTNYISTAALMLSIWACNNENDLTSAFYGDADAVRINATVGNLAETRSNPTGDAAAQAKFNPGDRIGITTDPLQPGITYILGADGTTWTPADPAKYLRWTADQMQFNAYYPATDGVSYYNFTLPADQSTVEKIASADYMRANVFPKKADGSISLEFNRNTALVVIDNIIFNDQYKTGYEVSSITVHGNYTRRFLDGTQPSVQSGDVTVKPLHSNGKWYALLLTTMGGEANKTFLTLTVKKTGSAEGADETTLTIKGIPNLRDSNKYAYTLTVGKKIATIGNVTVEAWGDGTPIQGGEAEAPVE